MGSSLSPVRSVRRWLSGEAMKGLSRSRASSNASPSSLSTSGSGMRRSKSSSAIFSSSQTQPSLLTVPVQGKEDDDQPEQEADPDFFESDEAPVFRSNFVGIACAGEANDMNYYEPTHNAVLYPGVFAYGDDAAFISCTSHSTIFGVADGVGGWRVNGVDPGLVSRALMTSAHKLALECKNAVSPAELLQQSWAKVTQLGIEYGSTTATIISINASEDPEQGTIVRLNARVLGDSSFAVLRHGHIVGGSHCEREDFNRPRQLSVGVQGHNPEDATAFEMELREGDVVVVASDGLWDNLFWLEDHVLRKAVEEEARYLYAQDTRQSWDKLLEISNNTVSRKRWREAMKRLGQMVENSVNKSQRHSVGAMCVDFSESIVEQMVEGEGKPDDLTIMIARVMGTGQPTPPLPPLLDEDSEQELEMEGYEQEEYVDNGVDNGVDEEVDGVEDVEVLETRSEEAGGEIEKQKVQMEDVDVLETETRREDAGGEFGKHKVWMETMTEDGLIGNEEERSEHLQNWNGSDATRVVVHQNVSSKPHDNSFSYTENETQQVKDLPFVKMWQDTMDGGWTNTTTEDQNWEVTSTTVDTFSVHHCYSSFVSSSSAPTKKSAAFFSRFLPHSVPVSTTKKQNCSPKQLVGFFLSSLVSSFW